MLVTFQNPGVLDPRSITTFGTSSKDHPNSAIGYFGTGLKYAIAILLRNDHKVEIQSGHTTYTFYSEREKLRNDEFNFIYMQESGQAAPLRLAFTTELGKDWSMTDAYRELHSNTLDEGGTILSGTIPHNPDLTTISISGKAFHDAYLLRDTLFLTTTPIAKSGPLEVHQGKTSGVYFKGVRVHTFPDPVPYTFNFTRGIRLTENRSVDNVWDLQRQLVTSIEQLRDVDIIRSILLNNSFLHTLDWHWSAEPSEEFLSVLGPLVESRSALLNNSMIAYYRSHRPEKFNPPIYIPTQVEEKMLDKALAFLSAINHKVEYDITLCQDLGTSVMGLAKNEQIYLSRQCFTRGTKYLASTIFEEYTHLQTGYADNTYEMQTHLFDTIISLGEEIVGEPL